MYRNENVDVRYREVIIKEWIEIAKEENREISEPKGKLEYA